VLPSSDVAMLLALGGVSFHWTAIDATRVRAPRSTGSRWRPSRLSSTAASAYVPGS
jgi:hypothetical protein